MCVIGVAEAVDLLAQRQGRLGVIVPRMSGS